MKLYYSPGACSLAVHIALREAGLEFELVRVDLVTYRTEDGREFAAINPKRYVPALDIDGQNILTEVPTLLQYVADQAPTRGLAPAPGTLARYRLTEWLGFINSEVHKTLSPMFSATLESSARQATLERVMRRFALIVSTLAEKPYLMGTEFTVADAYLYTMLLWARHLRFDFTALPSLLAFRDRIGQRSAVRAALIAEGLIKS